MLVFRQRLKLSGRIFVCSRCLLRVSWTKISLKSFCYLNGMDHISSGEVTFRCSWNVMVKFLEDKGEVVGWIRICLWKILSRRSHNSCCALAHQLMCTCIPRVVQSSISWCAAILHKMLCLCSQTPTFFYSYLNIIHKNDTEIGRASCRERV